MLLYYNLTLHGEWAWGQGAESNTTVVSNFMSVTQCVRQIVPGHPDLMQQVFVGNSLET